MSTRRFALVPVLALLSAATFGQSPPAPSQAKRAVDERKAIFTLVGIYFRPLGEQLQGRVSLDPAEARKRAERLSFLAALSSEAFSDVSNVGNPATRAKADIWSKRSEFDKSLADFVKHARTLQQVTASHGPKSEEFKAAASAVAEDCKACHDSFRSK